MNIGFEYIKYRWKAKNRHGIHSPFVYTFTDECLTQKIDPGIQNEINTIISKLEKDSKTIEIKDFGAGSKKLGNRRKISSILKTSSSKGKYGKLLYQLSKYYPSKSILEFGTSLGLGSIYLQSGNRDTFLTTVEACENTQKEAIKNFKTINLGSINTRLSTFKEYLASVTKESFDIVFVDGHHDGEALLEYMESLKAITHNETIFVLDDIRWSQSMLDAWNKIIEDPYYHVSMDIFRMGIVVPRHQQVKEHFVIQL